MASVGPESSVTRVHTYTKLKMYDVESLWCVDIRTRISPVALSARSSALPHAGDSRVTVLFARASENR